MISKFDSLETAIHMTLDRLSNDEPVDIKDEWIEEAAEAFKAALYKQSGRAAQEFRLRMSNIGKPLCQLQKENSKAPKNRMPYNHVMRMIIGDAVEAAMILIIRASGINMTNQKTKVSMMVNNTEIKGEDDVEIDGEVWDIKSSAPWAFVNKWAYGWEGVYSGDTFGYVAQLWGYAKASNRPMGGWIVTDKSSGEVKVVRATPTKSQIKEIEENVHFTEQVLANNMPFKRGFKEEEEVFRKIPTGNLVLPKICTFCQFMKDCWPDAVLKPRAKSEAQNRAMIWYSEYDETNG